jgi:hypothetical protein
MMISGQSGYYPVNNIMEKQSKLLYFLFDKKSNGDVEICAIGVAKFVDKRA